MAVLLIPEYAEKSHIDAENGVNNTGPKELDAGTLSVLKSRGE